MGFGSEKEHNMQINRLFEMVYLLLDKKQMTAKELAEHFEVSTRTVYRDVETLSAAGIPIYMSKGKGGGILLLPDFVLNKTVITEEERADILSSLKAVQAVSVTESGTALDKLGSLFGVQDVDWIEVDFGLWSDGEKESTLFELLKSAILEKKIVHFKYAATGNEMKVRIVEPLKLVFKASNWYLYAYCRLREDCRFFKLKRIREVEVMQENFERRIPKKVLQNETSNKEGEYVQVLLRFDRQAAFRAMDDFAECEIQSDGSVLVNCEYMIGEWLTDIVIGYGEQCEVIKPQWLRDEVEEKLCRMVERYKG